MVRGRRPNKVDVRGALRGLRINQGITSAMLPTITFEPTLGITAGRIDKLGMDIRSFHEPLKRSIQQVIAPSFRKNFEAEGRPSWEPLSEATIHIQRTLDGTAEHPVLDKSGRMKRVMQQLNIWTISRTSAIIKDVPGSIWYASVQQAGLNFKQKTKGPTGRQLRQQGKRNLFKAYEGKGSGSITIPPRPFVMLHDEDIKDIHAVFEKWLGERIDRAWKR